MNYGIVITEGLGPLSQLNYISWGAAVIANDHPSSVRNWCLIEVIDVVFVLLLCFCSFLWVVRVFCHKTESDNFLFVLYPIVECHRTDEGSLCMPYSP